MIRLWIDKEGRDLDGWNALIKRGTQAEAKAKIQASASRDLDQHCHRGNRLLYTSAAKAQAPKDPRPEEPKARGPESSIFPPRSNNSELAAKVWREKKKDRRRQDKWQQEGSTPATGVNAAKPGEPK